MTHYQIIVCQDNELSWEDLEMFWLSESPTVKSFLFKSMIELADSDLLQDRVKSILFDQNYRAGCSWALFYQRKGEDWNVLLSSEAITS